MSQILVVDDENSVRHVLESYLSGLGHEVHTADSAEAAVELLSGISAPDVALIDIVLPGRNGLQLMADVHRKDPETRVIVMTSHASVDTAIGAIRRGAHDYLQKPFDSLEQVASIVGSAVEKRYRSSELDELVDRQKVLADKLAEKTAGLTDSGGERS